MRFGASVRFGRHGVSAAVAVFAAGALLEDLLAPVVVIGAEPYDRGPEAALVAVLCGVVVLVALRARLGVAAPVAAVSLIGVASLAAPAWVLDSSFVYLLVMLLCGLSGFLATSGQGQAGLLLIWTAASLAVWQHPEGGGGRWASVVAFTTIAWVMGRLLRGPVVRARSAEERAANLEQEQAAAAGRAVSAERQRIARELHDVIAHSVSVMTVQAGAVRRRLDPDQVRERDSLLAVEQTGRDALAEMRRLVGLLKEDGAGPDYAPQPGLQALDNLIATMSAAGLAVDLVVDGAPRDLSPGAELTAYRVVQESLTNALKHAGPARARVWIQWSDDALRIDVANDCSTAAGADGGPGPGHGHAGMRERLRLYGGHVEAGPDDGAYIVRAYLPTGVQV